MLIRPRLIGRSALFSVFCVPEKGLFRFRCAWLCVLRLDGDRVKRQLHQSFTVGLPLAWGSAGGKCLRTVVYGAPSGTRLANPTGPGNNTLVRSTNQIWMLLKLLLPFPF